MIIIIIDAPADYYVVLCYVFVLLLSYYDFQRVFRG